MSDNKEMQEFYMHVLADTDKREEEVVAIIRCNLETNLPWNHFLAVHFQQIACFDDSCTLVLANQPLWLWEKDQILQMPATRFLSIAAARNRVGLLPSG